MIEVKVPKDILKYEAKFVGPFTAKQLICGAIAIAIDVFLYNVLLKPANISNEILFYIICFIDIPIFALSVNNPLGIPLKKYIELLVFYTFVVPKKRKNTKTFVCQNLNDKGKIKKSKIHKAYK